METATGPAVMFAPSSSSETATATATAAVSTAPLAAYEDDPRQSSSQGPKSAGLSTLPQHAPQALQPLASSSTTGARFHEDCAASSPSDPPHASPRLRSSRPHKTLPIKPPAPLKTLLDLPVDVLKEIVKEVTHTNDLTSLALCHSALHALTIPHIYSRFDIVWPDTNTHSEPRSGVDALTYGLATLVMGEEVFGEAPFQQRKRRERATETTIRRRRGNHYAQFTRKFSLGNGPTDWVQEYLITKEGGKMLGTLVALAVARMRSLEAFVWDMPTGILRDVWLSLSSLGENRGVQREGEGDCRLEKVWVRWHDNTAAHHDASGHPLHPPGLVLPSPNASTLGAPFYPSSLSRVETPTFSVLPPLRSLSVLDIDELAYLDEMAVLVGRSIDKLRELRIGLAKHVVGREWTTVYEGEDAVQVDRERPEWSSVTIGEKRLGGVLGVIGGCVRDVRERKEMAPPPPKPRRKTTPTAGSGEDAVASLLEASPADRVMLEDSIAEILRETSEQTAARLAHAYSIPDAMTGPVDPSSLTQTAHSSPLAGAPPMDSQALLPEARPVTHPAGAFPDADSDVVLVAAPTNRSRVSSTASVVDTPVIAEADEALQEAHEQPHLSGKLSLHTLELERIPLSIPVIQQTFDWTLLTSLTLLHCANHEQLWKTLRRTYAPTPRSPIYPQPRRSSAISPRKFSRGTSSLGGLGAAESDLQYGLNLKKVHTNTVTTALITFLKETLAPNTLETIFLQDSPSVSPRNSAGSSVTVEQIYKGPLRRHRGSLRRLLIDSSDQSVDRAGTVGAGSARWRKWMLNREVLGFVCGGKMSGLRELGGCVEYRDWVSLRSIAFCCVAAQFADSLDAALPRAVSTRDPASPQPLYPFHCGPCERT